LYGRVPDLTKLPAAVTRGYTAVAIAATVVAASVHFATYGPEEWAPSLTAIWPVIFVGIFLIALPAIVALTMSGWPLDVVLGQLPPFIKIAGVVGTAYVAINFGLMFKALSGHSQPAIYVARLFTGHAMYFYGFAAVIGYQLDRIRRGRLVLRGPRDDALEASPLPPPLSRRVVLQTALSRSECAARLLRPQPRKPFAFVGAYGMRGEADPDAFRLELGGPRSSLVYAVGRFEGTGPIFIRVLLTFKRWHLIAIAATLLVLPLASLVGFGWQGVAFVIVVAGGGNLAFGLAQMRSLLQQIQRATEAQPVSIG
jgi:hypothetical protein